ncbi:MAG: hypothetical protein SCARUB_03035 [Candidatus Scalindua rubra]|uniref:Radical SAM core domain-containing protein n=1 Tax=Candidatus Scalindua rubra TaxID=1872076 RepID=A0A1E3X8B1_9BACT|nr:MAG: hypothetical protein SCARUB_03035 [Candidatus Scalindua rubra]
MYTSQKPKVISLSACLPKRSSQSDGSAQAHHSDTSLWRVPSGTTYGMIGQITRKTLLYKSKVEYADFCLNHVEGCSHGCRYPCYAYMMKKRCGVVKTYEDWCQPKIVANALELLDKEILKYKNKIKYVHLCFSTDPFMYNQKQVCDLSLKIIDKLNANNIHCTVLTKGVFPRELGNRNGFSNNNKYGITLVSLDEYFRKEFEPNSANFKDRICSLKYLHKKGFKTWVSIEPYPTPNLSLFNILTS